MAVTLDGANGIFQRARELEDLRRQVTVTHIPLLDADIDAALAEFENAGDHDMAQALVAQRARLRLEHSQRVYQTTEIVMRKTLADMVFDDTPQVGLGIRESLDELIRQMDSSSDTVDGNTTSTAVAADAGNTGDGTAIASADDAEGNAQQTVRSQAIVLECVKDAQFAGTQGEEQFSVIGEVGIGGPGDPDWPGGTGDLGRVTVSSPDVDGSTKAGRNLLTNSNMEEFGTTDVLDNWTYVTGTAGTHFFEDAANAYRGTKCLKVKESGGVLNKVQQQLSTVLVIGQTLAKLRAETKYFWSVRLKMDVASGSGFARISLRDGAGVEIGGSALTIDISALTTSYQLTTKVWNTELKLPDAVFMVVEITAVPEGGRSMFVDDLQLVHMQQWGGASGPYLNLIAGAAPFVVEDRITVTISNNGEGELQAAFDRWFGMHSADQRLPFKTDGSETIPD